MLLPILLLAIGFSARKFYVRHSREQASASISFVNTGYQIGGFPAGSSVELDIVYRSPQVGELDFNMLLELYIGKN